MGVAKTGHAHASGTIDVLLVLLIPQARPRTAHDGDAPLGVHPAGVALLELLYGRHVRSFLRLYRQRVSGGPYHFRPTRLRALPSATVSAEGFGRSLPLPPDPSARPSFTVS